MFLSYSIQKHGQSYDIHDELEVEGSMNAIEILFKRDLVISWLEIDSKLVSLAFKSLYIVSWQLRNEWHNYIYLILKISIIISHI